MNNNGKILFFNANDGKGIIITAKKEKISFSVEDWDDFEVMPSLGLEVCFKYENSLASEIVSLENYVEVDEIVTTQEVAPEVPVKEPQEEHREPEKPEEVNSSNTSLEENSSDLDKHEVLNQETTDFEEVPEEDSKEHFETEKEISELSPNIDIDEEIGERESSVTVTLNLSIAVKNYFDVIKNNIDRREAYRKVDGRLNYLLIRRFLWTTFNNLSEIDLHIITPKIKAQSDDLKAMAKIYDDFMTKIKHPPLAYEEVFLSCQAEYMKIKDGADKTIEKLNHLKGSEKHVGGVLKIKKDELEKEIQSEEFGVLKEELKSLNGAYVDIVHMMAELDERYKHDMELLKEFEKEYREDFYELFNKAAVVYKKNIVDILSAQAFMLDKKLWDKAKGSKALKAHFHKAGIDGEFNTKTYLKYYLDAQDATKLTGENKKLLELYQYLVSLHKDYIMIVASSAQDAMDYEVDIKRVDKSFEVKSFIDEISALKWAMKNSVKVLVLEDRLAKINVESFLKYYKKYILVIPKIIVLGESVKSDDYSVSKLLSKGISPRVLAENVKELLPSK